MEILASLREYPDSDQPYYTIKFKNHWNKRDIVVLIVGDREYNLVASEVIAAVKSCTSVL
jgi:hypothetical protein